MRRRRTVSAYRIEEARWVSASVWERRETWEWWRLIRCVLRQTHQLTACDSTHDEKRFRPSRDGVGEWSVGPLMREILLTRKKAKERPSFTVGVVSNRTTKHRISGLQLVEDGAYGRRGFDVQSHFVPHARERS